MLACKICKGKAVINELLQNLCGIYQVFCLNNACKNFNFLHMDIHTKRVSAVKEWNDANKEEI